MAPPAYDVVRHDSSLYPRQGTTSRPDNWDWRKTASKEALVLESWSEGFMVGALVIMACITIANMRRGVLLHKLVLLELFLAMSHGTFCFMSFKGYGWYLSSTAAFLYLSWIIHNIVAWMKVRPFFVQPGGFFKPKVGLWTQGIYHITLAMTVPVVLFQISNNYRFFNNRGGWYESVRPYEPLFRDPWWLFTCAAFFRVIMKCYGTGVIGLVRRSPRFGILLAAICLAIIFTICDIAASANALVLSTGKGTDGINPWWKIALVFKCLTDTILLDDFKTELKRLGVKRIAKEEKRRNSIALVQDRNSSSAHTSSAVKLEGGWDDDHSSGESGKKGQETWLGGQNPTSGVHDALDLSPTTTNVRKNDTVTDMSNHSLGNAGATSGDIDFETALALGPAGCGQPEHIEYASDRGHRIRRHINSTKTKISRLPGLHESRFEAIKPGKKSQTRHSDEYHDAMRQTSISPDLNRDITDKIDPLSNFGVVKEESSFQPDDSEPQSPLWIQGTPRNQDELFERSQLYHEEMAEMAEVRNSVESERRMRERRFRQSIGVPNDNNK